MSQASSRNPYLTVDAIIEYEEKIVLIQLKTSPTAGPCAAVLWNTEKAWKTLYFGKPKKKPIWILFRMNNFTPIPNPAAICGFIRLHAYILRLLPISAF